MWEQGSNADIALNDIAVGAACFNKGKVLLTWHDKMDRGNGLINEYKLFLVKVKGVILRSPAPLLCHHINV